MVKDVGIENFSMDEFLAWMSENKESVSHFELNQVDILANCKIQMKDDRLQTLNGCGAMGVKEAHEKICNAFDIDISRPITDIKIHVCYDGIPEVTIKELRKENKEV